jgi:hypothetical protein
MIYYKENYKKIKNDNPKMNAKDLTIICAQKWKNMKPNEKLKYENKSNKEKENYKKQINI